MGGKAIRTYQDYSREKASASIHLPTLTAGNIAAQTTLITALNTAMDGISLGNPNLETVQSSINELSNSPAGSVHAQRENKWLVSFSDDVSGTPGTMTIPCADLTKLIPNTDLADLTDTAMAAFVTAFEAVALSSTGHSVTIIQIKFVGRNS